jgi:hypothetical protein
VKQTLLRLTRLKRPRYDVLLETSVLLLNYIAYAVERKKQEIHDRILKSIWLKKAK